MCGGVFRVSGADAVYSSVAAAGNDAAAVTLDEVRDWLFIAVGTTKRSDNDYTAAPTGYGAVTLYENNADIASTAVQTFAYATKAENKGVSEDPDAWTVTGTQDSARSLVIAIAPAAGSTDPEVSSTSKLQDGQAFSVSGLNFESPQGTGTLLISPTDDSADLGAVAQTVDTWGLTAITVLAADLAGMSPGDTVYVFVKNNTGDENLAGFAVPIADMVVRAGSGALADVVKDTDSGAALGESVEVIVWGGTAAARSLLFNDDQNASFSAGVLEVADSTVANITTEDDDVYVTWISIANPATRMGTLPAVVVDRNED
jgi:hypothetical protein